VTVATRELTLVTQDDCHFCVRAHKLLAALGVSAREVAVDPTEAGELAARGIPLALLPDTVERRWVACRRPLQTPPTAINASRASHIARPLTLLSGVASPLPRSAKDQ
jgi:hypothetical protein